MKYFVFCICPFPFLVNILLYLQIEYILVIYKTKYLDVNV